MAWRGIRAYHHFDDVYFIRADRQTYLIKDKLNAAGALYIKDPQPHWFITKDKLDGLGIKAYKFVFWEGNLGGGITKGTHWASDGEIFDGFVEVLDMGDSYTKCKILKVLDDPDITTEELIRMTAVKLTIKEKQKKHESNNI